MPPYPAPLECPFLILERGVPQIHTGSSHPPPPGVNHSHRRGLLEEGGGPGGGLPTSRHHFPGLPASLQHHTGGCKSQLGKPRAAVSSGCRAEGGGRLKCAPGPRAEGDIQRMQGPPQVQEAPYQQLRGAEDVQGEGLDTGVVHSQLPVDAGALNARQDAQVGGEPRGVCGVGGSASPPGPPTLSVPLHPRAPAYPAPHSHSTACCLACSSPR